MKLKRINFLIIFGFFLALVILPKTVIAQGLSSGYFMAPSGSGSIAIDYDKGLFVQYHSVIFSDTADYAMDFYIKTYGSNDDDDKYIMRLSAEEYDRSRNEIIWRGTFHKDEMSRKLDKSKNYTLVAQLSERNGNFPADKTTIYYKKSQGATLEDESVEAYEYDINNSLDPIIFAPDRDLNTSDKIFVTAHTRFDSREYAPKIIYRQITTEKMHRPLAVNNLSNCEVLRYYIGDDAMQLIEDNMHTYCYRATIPHGSGEEGKDFNFESGKYEIWAQIEDDVGELEDDTNLNDALYKSNIISTWINFILKGDTIYAPSDQADYLADKVPEDTQRNDNLESNRDVVIGNNYAFVSSTDCIDISIYNDEQCQQFKAMVEDDVDDQCLANGIYDIDRCENFLRTKEVAKECLSEDIKDEEGCKDFILEKYASTVECGLGDIIKCKEILREKYLNRLVSKKKRQDNIASSTRDFFGENVDLADLNQSLLDNDISEGVQPLLVVPNIKVLVAKSTEQSILESEDQLTVRNKAVIILDNDADGLSDDAEKYYGTDPNNPDTDGDSKSDREEIRSGSNPNGEGVFDMKISNLDLLTLLDREVEQPKVFSDKIDENFKIDFVKNDNEVINLSGQAEPYAWVNIFLYSDLPLVMTARADESGNWVYDLQHSLVDGGHKVYVTVNDDTGNIVKQSSPLAFLVKSARAVTPDQYFTSDDDVVVGEHKMLSIYILGAVFLIIFGIAFIFLLHHQNKSNT